MPVRGHARPWVPALLLVVLAAALVVPATALYPKAQAEPMTPADRQAPAMDLAARPIVGQAVTQQAVRRAAAAQARYNAALLPPLVRQAIGWTILQRDFPTRTCLYFARIALQVPRRFPTAMSAWVHARYRHRTSIWSIPPGVPVFTKGASAAGHIAISLGNGWVRSTDWPRDGLVGDVQLTTLLAKWRHRYLGWSEDLNGVRVWNLGPQGWAGAWSAPHRR